ncbi:MAG TPA: GAF domain-containing protein, partial [Longimicrobiales bacterium]|nr:GAF domain-containing protein [Longimicrobiales bacterium]
MNKVDAPLDEVFARVLRAMPDGWQYPGVCRPMLRVGDRTYRLPDFQSSAWVQRTPVRVDGQEVGELCMYYAERRPDRDEGPFLKEERQLLDTLADRVGLFLLQRERVAARPRDPWRSASGDGDWRVVLEFLRRTDPRLLRRITVKMLNLLRWKGVGEVERLFEGEAEVGRQGEENRPGPRAPARATLPTEQVFALAEMSCTPEEILGYIEMWMGQDKVGFLVDTVEEQSSSLVDITDALERFQILGMEESELPASVQTTVRVALLRRFFTDQLAFINIAKGLTTIGDFQELVQRVLHPPRSHGKLGGKSAGLFLARKIVEASAEYASVLKD